MRLIMAVSADGFLCRDRQDRMDWTGMEDKKIFRALTGVDGVCAVGIRTWNLMPALEGRQLIPISRSSYTLEQFSRRPKEGWLLGGPTVAKAAIVLNLVSEFHACFVRDVHLGHGIPLKDVLDPGRPAMVTEFEHISLGVFRFGT